MYSSHHEFIKCELKHCFVEYILNIIYKILFRKEKTMANSSNNNVKPILQQQSSIIDELDKIEKFFQQLQKPKNLYEIRDRAHRFCQQNLDRKIVLITVINMTFVHLNLIRMIFLIHISLVVQPFLWNIILYDLLIILVPVHVVLLQSSKCYGLV